MKFASGGAQSTSIRQEHIYSEGRTSVQLDKQVIFQSYLSLIELGIIRFTTRDIPQTKKEQTITKIRLCNIHPSQIEHEVERLFNDKRMPAMTPELFDWLKSTSF